MANLQFFRVYNFIGIFSLSLSISLPQIYLSQLHDDLLSRVRVRAVRHQTCIKFRHPRRPNHFLPVPPQ